MKHINTYSNFKLYENNRSDFTSMFRYNGYMIDRKDEEKVRKMFNGLLTKIYYEDSDLLNDIVDDMANGDDFWWIGDGEYFKDFSFDEEQKVWYIIYCEEQFDEESDYITDIEKSQSIMNFHISVICDLFDFIMKDKRVSHLLNYKAVKKINESKFTDRFKSDKEIRMTFNALLDKLYNDDRGYEIFKKIELELRGTRGLDNPFEIENGEFDGFNKPFGEKFWYIDYIEFDDKIDYSESPDEYTYETISSETCPISYLIDIINIIVRDRSVITFINLDVLKKINRLQ